MHTTSQYTVDSCAELPCDPERAWEKLCFYEHLPTRPSWLLRTVLPVPLSATGAYRKVGDTSRCQYSDGGFLTKRIKHVVAGELIDFEITEHTIRYARHIVLKGGTIQIVALDDGRSGIRMLTRYELTSPMLWVVRPLVDWVIGEMHAIVIRGLQCRLALTRRQRAEAISAV